MGWKVIFGIFVFIVLSVSLVLFFTGDEEINYEEEEGLDESSPVRVGVSQEKLESVSSDVKEDKKIEPRVINLVFESVLDTFELAKNRQLLNLNESVVGVFGYKAYEPSMINFLKRGKIKTNLYRDVNYEQKIIFPETLEFEEFTDEDYLDGETYAGFYIEEGEDILGYSLSFVDKVSWDELRGTFVPFMGQTYYMRSLDGGPENIEFWEEAYQFSVYEGEVVDVIHPTLGLTRLEIERLKEDSSHLFIDGELQEQFKEGSSYVVGGKLFYVEEIGYSEVTAGFVRLTLGARPLYFGQLEIVNNESKILEEIDLTYVGDNEYLEEIMVTWKALDTIIVSPTYKQTFPFFESLTLSMIKGDYDDEDDYFTVANVTGKKTLLKEV